MTLLHFKCPFDCGSDLVAAAILCKKQEVPSFRHTPLYSSTYQNLLNLSSFFLRASQYLMTDHTYSIKGQITIACLVGLALFALLNLFNYDDSGSVSAHKDDEYRLHLDRTTNF